MTYYNILHIKVHFDNIGMSQTRRMIIPTFILIGQWYFFFKFMPCPGNYFKSLWYSFRLYLVESGPTRVSSSQSRTSRDPRVSIRNTSSVIYACVYIFGYPLSIPDFLYPLAVKTSVTRLELVGNCILDNDRPS